MSYLISAFAVYRVSRMIALEDGFFDVFSLWRGFLFQRFGEKHWVTRGWNCPLCLSFWVGMLVAFLLPGNFILMWMGLSGAATFLYRLER